MRIKGLSSGYPSTFSRVEYGTKKALTWRIDRLYIVRDVEDSRLIRAGVNLRNERVYHEKGSSLDDFFFTYANFVDQLCIRVPFTEFQMVVLREMNVAQAQLHPNAWAVVQAFLEMCLAIGITPTIPVFFHYFYFRPPPKGGEMRTSRPSYSPKKVYEDLRAAMEQMLIAQEESNKKNDEPQAELYKARKALAKASNRLRDARANYDRLNRALTDDLAMAKEKISELETGIVFEHEEGFNKALRQVSILARIREPYFLGFDIEKDVFDGEVEVEDVNDASDDAEEIEAAMGDDDGRGAE
ncbi:hypothetical protein LR48_Vigan04g050500 [Vigna angularis]|uniref:Transposase (putative) gypsy type domain-containing protein n=1 Tax=Phaseolus angularis TaxID=3914 RepID=A0A0L9UCM0_PHAAN|nr:hypothetical protein LR48_Vigan04g050500 [Vigna angularis]